MADMKDREDRSTDISSNLEMVLQIPVKVTAEVGSISMLLQDILRLETGTVLSLNRKVGESIDIQANGTLIAKGDVIKAEGKLGVRIVEVVSLHDRLSALD
ncbi:MAG: FliM/FliN family flagellar motor switch protein [Zetaproteobacteria bacterium]|nr:FliM/FliN family flagellar motor switch protein [Zetaproteobacteria bacterium]